MTMIPKLTEVQDVGTRNTIGGLLTAAVSYLIGIDFELAKIDPSELYAWCLSLAALFGWVSTGNLKKPSPEQAKRVYDLSLPLGMRINNPGNLRPDSQWTWQGQIGIYKPERGGGYVEFDTIDNGMRAAAKNLINQKRKHGITTINDLIRKYAPPEDNNDTDAYIASMESHTKIDKHREIDLENVNTATLVLRGIIKHEQGRVDYSTDMIKRGVIAAL